MLKKTFGLILIVIMVFVSGCSGEAPPETGRVMNRKFIKEHWESGYETYYVNEYNCGYDSVYDYQAGEYKYQYDCRWEDVAKRRYEEHHIWHENQWSLLLRKCEKKDDGKEKCKEGWRHLEGADAQEEYKRHKIGDYYPKIKEN